MGYSSSLCYCDIERYNYATVTYIYSVLPHSLPNMSFQWCLLCLSLVIWIILANYCNIIVHLTLTYINMFLLKMTSYKQFGCSWKSSCLTDKCLTPITFQTKGPCRGNSLKRAPKGNKVLENSPDSSHGICAANDNGDKKNHRGKRGAVEKTFLPHGNLSRWSHVGLKECFSVCMCVCVFTSRMAETDQCINISTVSKSKEHRTKTTSFFLSYVHTVLHIKIVCHAYTDYYLVQQFVKLDVA